MSSLMPLPIPGHVVPGAKTQSIQVLKPWGWQTVLLRPGIISDTPWGPPIKPEPVQQPAPTKPKAIGDEAHHGIMNALYAMVAQHTTQITDALPGNRMWR